MAGSQRQLLRTKRGRAMPVHQALYKWPLGHLKMQAPNLPGKDCSDAWRIGDWSAIPPRTFCGMIAALALLQENDVRLGLENLK